MFYLVIQTLASGSYKKSQKVKAVGNGHHLPLEKDCQLVEKKYKYVEICNELYTVKQECTRKVWLQKKEIRNVEKDRKSLEERNKSLDQKNKACL